MAFQLLAFQNFTIGIPVVEIEPQASVALEGQKYMTAN